MELCMMYKSFLSIIIVLVYNCQATTIPFPPTMVRQPHHKQLFQVSQYEDENPKPFMLECEAQGNPEPVYRWMKDGEEFDYTIQNSRIVRQPRKGTLVVTKPVDVDEGSYQCFAENIHGISVSNVVHLRKSELNSFPGEDPKKIFVIEGEPLSLGCNPPSGFPKPEIFWIIQTISGAINRINSSRITVDPDGYLHFTNVTEADALNDAHYACSVTSLFRNEYRIGNKIILNVLKSETLAPNTFPLTKQYVSASNIVALRGQTLKLYCIYGGTPVPEVKWSKKGGNLQSSRIYTINSGKTLLIMKIDFQDEGMYECVANNNVSAPISNSMTVTIQAAPFWINSSNNTNAIDGETVQFECVAGGNPQPTVQWFINGTPMEDADPNARRKLDSSANILTITGLVQSDTAVFQCNASNLHGYAFRDYYLNVLSLPPTVIEHSKQAIKTVVSSVVTLSCPISGASKPLTKWLKDGQELNGEYFKVLENGDLEINYVHLQDEGNYICHVTNKYGDAAVTKRLEVKGKTKIIHPPEDYEVSSGTSATFRCYAEADADLALTVIWLHNGQTVDFDQDPRMIQYSDYSLTIVKTKERDSGVYTCVAKTDLDQDEAAATLTVQDVPDPPRIVEVQCDRFTASIKWQPSENRNAPILSYAVMFNTSFQPHTWEDAFSYIPAVDSHSKVSMTPWANYTFRVIARNKIGRSLPSNISDVCSTPEDVPHKNPDSVVGKGTEKDNLVISWMQMPMMEHNAPGFFYKVFWKRDDISSSNWEVVEIHDWERNNFVVSHQPSFKPYRVKVEAQNRMGQAHASAAEIIGHSGEDIPIEAPKNFIVVYVKDARSAMLSWDTVSAESVRGQFRGYKIQTWTADEGEQRFREQIVRPDVTRSLINTFRPFSRNFVRILAFNNKYEGPPSVTELITPEGTPGPVANFDAIPLSSNALYLTWKRPLEPNSILTGYRIYYSEVSGYSLKAEIERQPPITDPRVTCARLAGLKPKTTYRLSIWPTTSKGKGDLFSIEVRTNEEAERAIDEPDFIHSHLHDIDAKFGVHVAWMPAFNDHRGSHFYVQYKRKESDEPDFVCSDQLDVDNQPNVGVRVTWVDDQEKRAENQQ